MKFERIILTEADNEVGRALEADLRRHGHDVLLFRSTLKVKDRQNYINELKAFAEGSGAGIIIPVFYPETVAAHADELPGITVLTDTAEHIEMLDNKVRASALASRLGIDQPAVYSSPDEVESFPVVFKRSGGHGGDSVYFPAKKESLEHLVASSLPGTFLITEKVEGYEVSVDAIRWDGFFYGAAYRILLPRAKGASIMRESIDAPEIIATAGKILEEVGYRGVCGMDFIVSEDGRARFLECNPRFSGGLRLQIGAGFDMPEILLRLNRGEKVTPQQIRFRRGVIDADRKAVLKYLKRRHRQRKLDVKDLRLALKAICKGNA